MECPRMDRDLKPPNYKVEKTRFSKDLYGELLTADGSREVHAHLVPTAPSRTTGCLISVDGIAVGGDVGKSFVT